MLPTSSSQLPIDECEEWIWDILDCNKACGFEYIAADHKEFLILNTNDFYADTKALYKIRRLTGMRLIQMIPTMAVHNCGFSGRIMSTELIMISIVLRNEDNATRMASPVYEHSL